MRAVQVQDIYLLARYIAGAEQIVSDLGITIEFGTDFTQFCSIPEIQPERHPVSPIFDPLETAVSASNGFWLVGYDAAREVVLTQAIKLIRIDGQSGLLDHLRRNLADYRPYGDKLDISKSKVELTPRAAGLAGDACYYGELWIKKPYRGGSLTAVMPRLMFAVAVLKWSPQFVFGMMEPMAACKGLAAREGFMHLEQGSFQWQQYASNEPVEEWLVWTTMDDFLFNTRVPLGMLARLYPDRGTAESNSLGRSNVA